MADSDCDAEPRYNLQTYSLVRFVHRGRKRQVESVDIVPSKWLDFDKVKARCVVKFMDGPYNDEDLNLIHTLVMNNIDAPEDWPTFSVEQVGRAKTYEEGLRKIEHLKFQDNVLTLESEDSASEAQAQLTLAVKRQKLHAEASKLNAKFSSSTNDSQSQKSEDPCNTFKGQHLQNKEKKDCEAIASDENLLYTDRKDTSARPKKSSTSTKWKQSHSKSDKDIVEKSTPVNDNVDLRPPVFNEESMPPLSPVNLKNLCDLEEDIIINAPIIDVSNIECKTPFEQAVIMRLDQIHETLNKMHEVVDKMQIGQNKLAADVASLEDAQNATLNFLSDKKIMEKTTVDLKGKYGVEMPLSSYEALEVFDDMLRNNSYFKKDVYIELKAAMDKELSITKSMVKMLKKFIMKDLAQQFTAIRASSVNKNKYKFKPTQFCMLIEVVITKMRSDKGFSTDKDTLNFALTDVLTNVTKWKV